MEKWNATFVDIVVLLFAVGLSSLGLSLLRGFLIHKRDGKPFNDILLNHRYLRVYSRMSILLFALVAFLGSLQLIFAPRPAYNFIGAFLCVTAGQIFLWGLGVRLEILANVPSYFDVEATDSEKQQAIQGKLADSIKQIQVAELAVKKLSAVEKEKLLSRFFDEIGRLTASIVSAEAAMKIGALETNKAASAVREIVDSIQEELHHDPYSALLALNFNIEQATQQISEKYNIPPNERPSTPYSAMYDLNRRGILSNELYEAFLRFWIIRDAIVHNLLEEPLDKETYNDVIQLGGRLLVLLTLQGKQ
jgi:uncharacterized protein YutE (UPF0331/DUF86 family)